MVCRLSSVQLWANHRESADAVTTPWGGGRVGRGCLHSHRTAGKPRTFAIAMIRMFFTPLAWPLFLSPPLISDPCGLLMEESQKQETDNLGSGCSCD